MKTDITQFFGISIAQARKSAGMTQEDLAAKINVSARTYQAYEAGQILPRYKTLFKIAKETNTNAPDLIAPMWKQWLKT